MQYNQLHTYIYIYIYTIIKHVYMYHYKTCISAELHNKYI